MLNSRTYIRPFLIISALICVNSHLSSAYGQVRIGKVDDTRYLFNLYKPNYFTLELYDNDNGWYKFNSIPDARFQFSYAFGVTFRKIPQIFFVTYSQKSFWSLSKDSKPFREQNFNPGAFVYSDTLITNVLHFLTRSTFFEYASETGVEHESNGIDGFDSRGWNRVYGKLDLYKAFGTFEFKAYVKGWIPFKKSKVRFIDSNGMIQEEPDRLTENIGYFETSLFLKFPSFEAWVLLRQKNIEVHIKPFKLKSFFPTLLLFWGKGESLQHATENSVRFNVRLGLSLPYN